MWLSLRMGPLDFEKCFIAICYCKPEINPHLLQQKAFKVANPRQYALTMMLGTVS